MENKNFTSFYCQLVTINQISVSLDPIVSKCLFLRITVSVADLSFIQWALAWDQGQGSIFNEY